MNQTNSATKNQSQQIQTVAQTRLWTALVTPMLLNGDVDFVTLEKLAIEQANAGNGIALLGSTGEGLALTPTEQLSVVKCVSALSLTVPLMVSVGGYNLPNQLAWISQCNDLEISAYLLTCPIYTKPGEVGLTHWFSELLEQSEHPCMIYNIPSRSGINIPLAVMKNIQSHKNCWAMKEASGDMDTFKSYAQQCPELDIYSGEDAMVAHLLEAGVKGLVSVAANVWPQATHRYVNMALAGQHQTLFPIWDKAVEVLFQVASPIPVKVLMHLTNRLNYPTLRAPLTALEITDNPFALKSLMAIDIEINQWLEQSQS
ncbi:4-hydroxy-tetrahydrodipicolinate synthase [Thalassotalea sp. SU-HH00458]|uniref:4-hydroxy-tetrahydrodipicolinate synthase n=1 Tax=Thalassotalea sp. SU-HH00458 TaxID=3127657 RepID=UPI0031027506